MDVVQEYKEYDSGWIQIASTDPDITGDIHYRIVGKEVEIVGDVSGVIPLAPALVNPLPAVIWPTGPEQRFGIVHYGGARMGGVDVNDQGRLRLLNPHGDQSSAQFSIKYQIG